jgi:hypothetical protein
MTLLAVARASHEEDERRREMANDGAPKSAGQKPAVRIEYCTS